jgi:hypothetical protein
MYGEGSKVGPQDKVGATSWVREPKEQIVILMVVQKPSRKTCGTAFVLPARLGLKAFAAITPGMTLRSVGDLDVS